VVLLHYKHVRSMTNLEEENDTTKINPSHNMDQELCNKVLTTLYHVMKSWRFAKSEMTFETKIGQHHQIGICQRHQLTVREVGTNRSPKGFSFQIIAAKLPYLKRPFKTPRNVHGNEKNGFPTTQPRNPTIMAPLHWKNVAKT
jgi:hypothetical protein